MKYLNTLGILFSLIMLLSACNNCNKHLSSPEAFYEKSLNNFPDSLVNHFPMPSDSEEFGIICLNIKSTGILKGDIKIKEIDTLSNINRYLSGHFLSEKKYDEQKRKLRKYTKKVYKGSDSSLLYIFNMNHINEDYFISPVTGDQKYWGTYDEIVNKQKYVKIKYSADNKLPVPLFEENITLMREYDDTILRKDLVHYVMDAKPGVYSDNFPKLDTCLNFPNTWCNGYSKGASFYDDKNLIIYWIFVW